MVGLTLAPEPDDDGMVEPIPEPDAHTHGARRYFAPPFLLASVRFVIFLCRLSGFCALLSSLLGHSASPVCYAL